MGEEFEALVEAPEERKPFKCPVCTESFASLPEMRSHVKRMAESDDAHRKVHEKWVKKAAERRYSKPKESPPAEAPEEETEEAEEEEEKDPRYLIAKYGREGLNRVKFEMLKRVLDDYGDRIKGWQKKLILRRWEHYPWFRDDPYLMYTTLVTEAKIDQEIAVSIVRDVFYVEQQYADVLYQRGIQPVIFPGMPAAQPPQPVVFPHYAPQPQQPQVPAALPYRPPEPPSPPRAYQPPSATQPPPAYPQYQPPSPPPGVSRSEVEAIIEAKTAKLEERLIEGVRKMLEEKKKRDELEELRESVRSIVMKVKELDDRVAKGEVGSRESGELERLREDMERLRENVERLGGELEKREKDELLQRLEKYGKAVAALRKRVEELASGPRAQYESDAYKLIDRALGIVDYTAKSRKPLETLLRVIAPERFAGPPAPPAKGAEAPELKELEELGLLEEG